MFETPERLFEAIRLGDDSHLECKSALVAGSKVKGPSRAELADELAAFANAHGGVLVLRQPPVEAGVPERGDHEPPREVSRSA